MKLVEWVLRIAVFGTFTGHGTLALLGNESWLPYLGSVGIHGSLATQAMFIIGVIDLIIAFNVLIKPSKYLLIYAFIWAFCTALIRPLSGESWLAFVERAANWGAPLALYLLLFLKNKREPNSGDD